MFTSRVERTISAAHHNGPPDSRCFDNHGHDWKIIAEFEYSKLDEYGWGPDFGKVKKVIDYYDHTDLNARLPMATTSAENLAAALYHELAAVTGHTPSFLEVHEGNGNSVRYYGGH